MRSILAAGCLLLALHGSAMGATIYKWVDAEGITHFGAHPPAGQAATRMPSVSAPPPPEPAAPEPPITDERQHAADARVRQEVAEQEAQRQAYCDRLRISLAQLKNNPRLRIEDNGEQRRLSEDERSRRIAETEQNIATTCD